jgi:predicted CopG family antitoxin
LRAMRGPGESFSDVILRLVEEGASMRSPVRAAFRNWGA